MRPARGSRASGTFRACAAPRGTCRSCWARQTWRTCTESRRSIHIHTVRDMSTSRLGFFTCAQHLDDVQVLSSTCCECATAHAGRPGNAYYYLRAIFIFEALIAGRVRHRLDDAFAVREVGRRRRVLHRLDVNCCPRDTNSTARDKSHLRDPKQHPLSAPRRATSHIHRYSQF